MGRSKMESQEKRREPHFDTHHIVLEERKSAMLTGLKEVLSFDSEEVKLGTNGIPGGLGGERVCRHGML